MLRHWRISLPRPTSHRFLSDDECLRRINPRLTSVAEETTDCPSVPYDIMLGVTGGSPQYGLLGDVSGRRVAIDLNQTHTISLFGVQGRWKELHARHDRGDGIAAHPEYQCSSATPYDGHLPLQPHDGLPAGIHVDGEAKQRGPQIRALKETFGRRPRGLTDVLLLAPGRQVGRANARKYPGHRGPVPEVRRSRIADEPLAVPHGCRWQSATYIRQLNRIMKSLRDDLVRSTG